MGGKASSYAYVTLGILTPSSSEVFGVCKEFKKHFLKLEIRSAYSTFGEFESYAFKTVDEVRS
jgi:hypothetical protein